MALGAYLWKMECISCTPVRVIRCSRGRSGKGGALDFNFVMILIAFFCIWNIFLIFFWVVQVKMGRH